MFDIVNHRSGRGTAHVDWPGSTNAGGDTSGGEARNAMCRRSAFRRGIMGSPHIVLITADQLRKDALGCYGGQAVQTPHLDRLAAAGTTFHGAYTVSPWCMPSRCSLLTGQYPHNHGAYSNFRETRLDPEIPNLYTLLRSAGYATCHVGKCHYAPVPYGETRPDCTLPYESFHEYYRSLGIDHLVLQDDKQVSVWFSDDYSQDLDRAGHLAAYREAIWNRDHRKVFPFPGPAEWHPDAWVGRKAEELVNGYADERPMFLWLSLSGPHFPFDAPDDYLDRVDRRHVGQGASTEGEFNDPGRIHHVSFHGPRAVGGTPRPRGGGLLGIEGSGTTGTSVYTDAYWTELRTRYFANVALIDEQVGRVLEAVNRHFGDDVLIIFTADHGEMLGNHRLWGKHNCGYEDVLNVPLLVRYPGAPAPAETAARVMLTDLLPTCLDVAGIQNPGTDGMTLAANVVRGGCRYVFAEGEGFIAVTDGTAKYVVATRGDERLREFFDLERDPGEVHNVITQPEHAPKVIELQRAVEEFFMESLLP
jgi:arylsulfatase